MKSNLKHPLSPRGRAQALYVRYFTLAQFNDDLANCRRHGIVLESPIFFAMGIATEVPGKGPAWLVKAAVGNLAVLRGFVAAFPMPYLAFYRLGKQKLHVLSTPRFLSRIPHPASRISPPC